MYREHLEKLSKIAKTLKDQTEHFTRMDAHIDEHGVVEINKDWVKKHAVESLLLKHELKELVDEFFPEIADRVEYDYRKQWAENKEYERKQHEKLANPPVEG